MASAAAVLGPCIRCRESTAAIQVREAAYCATCYQRVFDEKVRPSLEHVRGAILWDNVVRPAPTPSAGRAEPAFAIAFDASVGSCVLLHAMHRKLRSTHQAPAALARTPERARIDVLYVDDSAVVPGLTSQTHEEVRSLVAAIAPDATFVALPLADVYTDQCGVAYTPQPQGHGTMAASLTHSLDTTAALQEALRTVQDTPSRLGLSAGRTRAEDLHRIFRHRVWHEAARARHCAALVWPQHASDAAAFTIEALAKGAGHKLAVEGAASLWIDDVLHLHPLRAHLPTELAFYATQHAIPTMDLPALIPQIPPTTESTYEAMVDKHSIGRLSASLISALQYGVSSTSSTVVGTASKLVIQDTRLWPTTPSITFPRIGAKAESSVRAVLQLPRWDPSTMRACPLCRFPAQPGAAQWKADHSMEPTSSSPTSASENALFAMLCYACLQVFDVTSSRTMYLPPDVLTLTQQPGRLAYSSSIPAEEAHDEDAAAMRAALAQPHGPRTTHAPQRVSVDAMRAHVASFLLE